VNSLQCAVKKLLTHSVASTTQSCRNYKSHYLLTETTHKAFSQPDFLVADVVLVVEPVFPRQPTTEPLQHAVAQYLQVTARRRLCNQSVT